MSALEQLTIDWHVNHDVLLLKGVLVRNTLLKLHSEKKRLAHIKEIDLSELEKIDSAGLALIAQIALQLFPNKIPVKGASPELISLIEAYKLPLELI
ncbi:STAS domain-containing protein [Thorsellia anophelis]|uniref:ABC-type transporter Mla maintaining outer membrane lipid asymmetry, MlaB component, contains STAS domain n=1 Tax=Thorsellia anophelis DSM 18579 TaxID=1123402 RepID=A0A1I0A9A8_9GAMM|nr:hypothetical protein [Thorsellia anophelis]SES90588.1 ABC-type transporter Mla maintaining outer membrane lipid asymmetry, MlaB component, contains STAS domain [Thorsellia anophelis DSM 18579]